MVSRISMLTTFFMALLFSFNLSANYMESLKASTGFDSEEEWFQSMLENTTDQMKAAGIPVVNSSFDIVGRNVSISFGKLSEKQFNKLVKDFNHPRLLEKIGHVYTYDPDKEYQLVDFLEPRMQALVGHRLLYWTEDELAQKLPGTGNLENNCWSTAVDILNFDNPMQLNITLWEQGDVLKQLRSESLTDRVSYVKGDTDENLLVSGRPEGASNPDEVLQPYDEFIVFNNGEDPLDLSHAGIYLAYGLVFQLSGVTVELDNFQVTFLDHAIFQYTLLSGSFSIDYRRLKDGASMASPQETLSLVATGQEAKVQHSHVAQEFLDHLIFLGDNNFARIFSVNVIEEGDSYTLEAPIGDRLLAPIGDSDL